jgi:hypothetical protein
VHHAPYEDLAAGAPEGTLAERDVVVPDVEVVGPPAHAELEIGAPAAGAHADRDQAEVLAVPVAAEDVGAQ